MAETKQNLSVVQKDITDDVNTKLDTLQKEGLVLPPNYNPSNALKSAFFAMTNSASGNLLEKCSKGSIANALLDMTIQGLSPVKTQCYFIPYGEQLKMSRSYFGTQAVIKRLSNVNDIWANIIYKGDEFTYENRKGRDYLISHTTSLENRDNEIIGAYAVIEQANGDMPITVMSRKEIEASWSQAKTKNVQQKFPQEMAKRTVINRAAKNYINTSDDSDILVESINQTTANEYEDDRIDKEGALDVEVSEKANTKEIAIDIPKETKKEFVKKAEAPKPVVEESKPIEQLKEEAEQVDWDLN